MSTSYKKFVENFVEEKISILEVVVVVVAMAESL